MKYISVIGLLFVSPILLTACQTPHTMMLKDGRIIEMADEPEFDKDSGFYEYETLEGKRVLVNKDEVLEIKEL